MENLIQKLKHPIKESKKIPSSLSYHHLYNTNGEHPWHSISQIAGSNKKPHDGKSVVSLNQSRSRTRTKSSSANIGKRN